MTRIRKQKRKKKYNYQRNKKKSNTLPSYRRPVVITCKQVRKAWDNKRSLKNNLKDMGLVYDVNKAFRIKTTKETLQPAVLDKKPSVDMEIKHTRSKPEVIRSLEGAASKRYPKSFRFSGGQVSWITKMLDKYGEDYKAMAKDPQNYYQDTPKQIRAKIQKFKKIPEQFSVYLKSRGLLKPTENSSEID